MLIKVTVEIERQEHKDELVNVIHTYKSFSRMC